MNLLHKNMNNDNNTENPTKRAYIVSSTSLPPSLQISNSMHPQKKKKPFYSQESSDQPTTSQVELEKKVKNETQNTTTTSAHYICNK